MIRQQLEEWVQLLSTIWLDQQPERSSELISDVFTWYESPFSEPITSKTQLLKEWESVLDQKDITFNTEILSITNNIGIIRWEAQFTSKSSGKTWKYDGIMRVVLGGEGKCTHFIQWFNAKTT